MNSTTLDALAEPNRLRIVELLRGRPCSVNEVALLLNLRQPQASKHLNTLAQAGLVSAEQNAQQRIYSLKPEPFLQLKDWADSFQAYWDQRLDGLEHYLKKGYCSMHDYQPLHISRTFDAPRQAVWDAWTQPEQFMQWYMPAPYSVPACTFDVRPGGTLQVDTQGPDGTIMPMTGEFKVVDEPAKLVMTSAPLDADGNKLFEVQHTLLLSETDGRTTLDITSEVLSAGPNASQYLDGMEPGLNQALDQLSDMLANLN